MFQIMTDAEIAAADEETLRVRVRELQSETRLWRETRDILEKSHSVLLAIHTGISTTNSRILDVIHLLMHPRPKKRTKKRKTRTKSRK